MIGTVRFDRDDGQVVATLDDSGRWSCDDPATLAALSAGFSPLDGTYSPAHGAFGVARLHDAAAVLGGTAEESPPAPDEPGLFY